MKKLSILSCSKISLFFVLLLNTCVMYAAEQNNDKSTFTKATHYTVKVQTRINYPFIEDTKASMIGTGFLINREKGLIMTNAHVVGRSKSLIDVMFKGHSFHSAKKIYVDPILDLAIIEIPREYIPKDAKEASLDCDADISSGMPVGAYGHPWDLSFTATRGIVSGTTYLGHADWIQTDAPINSGNSGGPLIGLSSGKVVGISSATLSKKETEGLNFALPIRYACKVVDLLIKDKDPSPANLDVIFFETKDNKPLKVAEVINAQNNPLRPGDVITGVVGHSDEIKNPYHLYHVLRGLGSSAALTIIRDGVQMEITIPLKLVPNMLDRKGIYFSGVLIAPNNFSDRTLGGANNAWMVNFIDSGSAAESEKIKEWDLLFKIDNKPLGKFDDVLSYLKSKSDSNAKVTLMFKRISDGKYKMNDYHEVQLAVQDEQLITVQ